MPVIYTGIEKICQRLVNTVKASTQHPKKHYSRPYSTTSLHEETQPSALPNLGTEGGEEPAAEPDEHVNMKAYISGSPLELLPGVSMLSSGC